MRIGGYRAISSYENNDRIAAAQCGFFMQRTIGEIAVPGVLSDTEKDTAVPQNSVKIEIKFLHTSCCFVYFRVE